MLAPIPPTSGIMGLAGVTVMRGIVAVEFSLIADPVDVTTFPGEVADGAKRDGNAGNGRNGV